MQCCQRRRQGSLSSYWHNLWQMQTRKIKMTMEMYYAVSLFLMIGCGYMSFNIGRREGVMKFLEYLEGNADRNGKLTIKITETTFEILK